jgi:hypothetical protein
MPSKDDLEPKMDTFANLIDGRAVDDHTRVQVCLKGTLLGFPATFEAIGAGWPFGVNYFIETEVIEDPNAPVNPSALNLTVLPRVARGFTQIFARILLIESKGQPVGDKRLEREFIFTYNNNEEAHRFCQYPGVYEKLMELHKFSKFSELLVKQGSGLWLAQPVNFRSLHPDVFRETFNTLADLGQILFDAF